MDLLAPLRRGDLYHRASVVLLAAVVAVLALAAVASAVPPIDLGTLPGFATSDAVAVNASGQVVGDARTSGGEMQAHAFSWTQAGGMVDLGTLPGFSTSKAVAVNASGQVVGIECPAEPCSENSPGVHAFSWTQAGGMVDLGTLGGKSSGAQAVNDSGQVVGSADTSGGNTDAALWNTASSTHATAVVDLGKLEGAKYAVATAINDSGQVVGKSYFPPEGHVAFSWTQAGGMVGLGTFSEATAVNASGQVILTAYGDADLPEGSFLWTQAGGLVELPARKVATAINDSGQVVLNGGFLVPAFSWTPVGGLVELEPFPGGVDSEAVAINDSGQVVGSTGGKAVLWNTATGSVSVASTTVVVDRRGEATIMLTCTGSAPTCGGTLTLTAEGTIGRGRNRHSSTVTIGTISGSIPSGETTTVALQLNAAGHTLLSEAHRSLSASLTILKSSPAPSEERTEAVYLVQQ